MAGAKRLKEKHEEQARALEARLTREGAAFYCETHGYLVDSRDPGAELEVRNQLVADGASADEAEALVNQVLAAAFDHCPGCAPKGSD